MSWLRPSLLAVVSALALVAAGIMLLPSSGLNAPRAEPLPLPEGDREIAWLYAATNTAAWERFVTAVQRVAADRPDLAPSADESRAFPDASTAVPEVVLRLRHGSLRFRWYKLTSDRKANDWIRALTHNRRPPLAVVGGSSSDLAIELAYALEARRLDVATPPLLLLTMATSDGASQPDGSPGPALTALYPRRTFRFCFTNRQMAERVTSFLWSQDDLRPDRDPVYLAFWEDDPYSKDLSERFLDALRQAPGRAAAAELPVSANIPYSVGGFQRPNRWEADAAKHLAEQLASHPEQRRPLLVLPGNTQPARRLLLGLVRNAPLDARRFVVATGDAIPFNAFCRDRNIAWPIQDLPFPLVFFCHRNPVDERAGFRPDLGARAATPNQGSPATGTEDLLLYEDIVQALAFAGVDGLPADADALRERLALAQRSDDGRIGTEGGTLLFDDDGNRRGGTGEHVACLRPITEGGRQLPQATIHVWAWQGGAAAKESWRPSRAPLALEYDAGSAGR